MRALSQLNKNKKGRSSGENLSCFPRITRKSAVSAIIAYVLLISISLGLSVLVFNWLKFYVGEDEVPECPDGVKIIIKDFSCVSGGGGYLNITLKNKGRFNIDGFSLRVNDRKDAEFGFYTLNDTGAPLKPGGECEGTYSFEDFDFETITLIEVQPFMSEGEKVICKSYALQKVECNSP